MPGSVGDRIAKAYDEHLFHGKTLQDLPDEPRFVINATNVQSGALWRFMKPYMRDYRVGEVKNPPHSAGAGGGGFVRVSAGAVPVRTALKRTATSSRARGLDLQRPPFTTRVVLSDGGVYDNLGLETAWKRYQTVLVSDAGGKTQEEEEPKTDWARHSYRVLNLIDNQVRSLRKRQVIDSFTSGTRKGAYWGIRTDIADYQLPDALNCPLDRTTQLAELPTRLKRLDERTQEQVDQLGLRGLRCGAAQAFELGAEAEAGLSISSIRGVRQRRGGRTWQRQASVRRGSESRNRRKTPYRLSRNRRKRRQVRRRLQVQRPEMRSPTRRRNPKYPRMRRLRTAGNSSRFPPNWSNISCWVRSTIAACCRILRCSETYGPRTPSILARSRTC